MRLYLAAPMRGLLDRNYPALDDAASALRSHGHEVVSPADLDREAGNDSREDQPLPYYLRRDFRALLDCDAVVVLPGWGQSEGVMWEVLFSRGVGIPTLEYPSLRPLVGEAGAWWRAAGERVPGMGATREVEVTPQGGKHAAVPYRLDLIDPLALFRLAAVLKTGGEKYGEDNWRLIPSQAHVNHALAHLYAHLAGDFQEGRVGHLERAFCRVMMALAVEIRAEEER